MARASLLTVVCAPLTAALLVAAGGCAGTPGGSTDDGSVAQPAEEGTPPVDDSGSSDDGDADTRPGGPEDTGGGDTRPGAPFDIEAFENIGGPLEDFRTSAAATCADGACTVTEVISESADAPEGCSVDSIQYDPPAEPEGADPSEQFIQRGTSVTAFISCPPEGTGDGEATG